MSLDKLKKVMKAGGEDLHTKVAQNKLMKVLLVTPGYKKQSDKNMF